MTFEAACDYIASLAPRGWRLGLDRMEEFVRRAQLLPSDQQFFHVAGTNGKGSTTTMIQSALVAQGFKTGGFFSPYVLDPRERVQINGELIPEHIFAQITEALMPIGESLSETDFGGVTEFEFKAALGLRAWKEAKCEYVALEVGLGGRLDATNVVSPVACAIVSIGLDHMHILGDTVEEIAFEKAGILKPGAPAVVGRMSDRARHVIEAQARSVGAELWRIDHEVQIQPYAGGVRVRTPRSEVTLSPSLFGPVQLQNAAVAYATLELGGAVRDLENVRRGIATATIPGRYQKMAVGSHSWIFDGAHNPDSATALAQMLKEEAKANMICITGMLAGHEPADFYPSLAPFVDEFWCVPIDFHRARDHEELAQSIGRMGFPVRIFETVSQAIEIARAEHKREILVSGSFYLVGDVMRRLLSARC